MVSNKHQVSFLKIWVVGILLFQISFSSITSQSALPFISGETIRLSSEELNLNSQEVRYNNRSDSTISVYYIHDYSFFYSQIDKIQVKRGQKSNFSIGATVGTLSGAAIGLALGSGSDFFGSSLAGIGAAAGAVLGFVTGSLVGLSSKTDNWKEVPMKDLKIGVTTNGGSAVGLGLTLMF
jgi:hypothetical protein